MNQIKLFILYLMALICFSSCNDEEENTPQYLFYKPIMEWGSSKSQIVSQMADCSILLDTENTLCCQSEGETVAYAFKNDKLNTVVVIPETTLSLDEILLAFNGYTLLNQYDNLTYLDERSNTIAEIENSYGFYTISWSQYGLDIANAVDLGLSVKWADVNLNISFADNAALSPEYAGDLTGLYSWGDPTGLKFSMDNNTLLSEISNTAYDIASSQWGGGWRMPTRNEMADLMVYCDWEWSEINGRKGYIVTGKNGNSIFMPITGYREFSKLESTWLGCYWTGSLYDYGSPFALIFASTYKSLNTTLSGSTWYPYQWNGFAIRPVCDY